MPTVTLVNPDTSSPSQPKRAYRTENHVLSAETDTGVINKLAFGLVGVSWPAGGTGSTMTVNVGLTSASLRAHDAVSIDTSAAGATSISDLAEWPFVQFTNTVALTGTVEIALS